MKKMLLCILMLASVVGANAQDTINPLFATTGPNVMGRGNFQLNASMEWYYGRMNNDWQNTQLHRLGGLANLRWGIGSRTELTFGFMGYQYNYPAIDYCTDTNQIDYKDIAYAPYIGAKLLLYKGKGWLPSVALKADLAMAFSRNVHYVSRNAIYSQYGNWVQPTIGLAFRNAIGDRWAVDYDINYTWNSLLPMMINPVSGSLHARWLATDKLMVSGGLSSGIWSGPLGGDFELRYLANPNFQLFLQGGYAGMSHDLKYRGTSQVHVVTGVSWKF